MQQRVDLDVTQAPAEGLVALAAVLIIGQPRRHRSAARRKVRDRSAVRSPASPNCWVPPSRTRTSSRGWCSLCRLIVLHPKFWLGLAVDLAVPLLWDLDCLRQYLCCVLAGHSEPPEPQNLASSGVCVRTELKISDFKCMRSKMLGLNLQFR